MTQAELQKLVDAAKAWYDALSPEQKRAADEEQRRSWARGEAGFGSDADEATYVKAMRNNDIDTLKRLDAESAARIAAVEQHL